MRPTSDAPTEEIPLVPRSLGTVTSTNNDYLVPSSRQEGYGREPIAGIPSTNFDDKIVGWQRVNLRTRPFYRVPVERKTPVHVFLDNVRVDDLIHLLYSTREGMEAPDRLVQIPSIEGDGPPLPIRLADIIAVLDGPFIDFLKGDIEQWELRAMYPDGPAVEIQKPERRCPVWLLVLTVILLVVAIAFGSFIYFCHDGRCITKLLDSADAYPFREVRLPLRNATDYILLAHPVGVEVIMYNDTRKDRSIHYAVAIHSDSASLEKEWTEVGRQGIKLAHDVFCESALAKDCNVSSSRGGLAQISGTFFGDKSMHSQIPLYLVEEDGEIAVKMWSNNGTRLETLGSLTTWASRKGAKISDAIFDEKETGIVLTGKTEQQQLCELKLRFSGHSSQYVGTSCSDLGKIPCASNKCSLSLLRVSARRYAVVAHPEKAVHKTIISFYNNVEGRFIREDRDIATVLHAERPLYLLREHGPLSICYVESAQLVCRLYSVHQ